MVTRLKLFIIIIFVALLQLPLAIRPLAAGEPEPALLVKVSFLLNFLRLTQWPPNAFQKPDQQLDLAVIGNTPIAAQIKKSLEGQLVKDNKTVQVTVYPDLQLWQQTGKMPHALFLSNDMAKQWAEILPLLATAPVLTMADFPDFCAQGGVLNLVRDGDRIRFEANPEAAKKASLTLNAQMLQLAEIVSTQRNQTP